MAELVLKVRDDPAPMGYQDGDIVHAFNDRAILWRHTQILTHYKREPGGFFKPVGGLAYQTLNAVSQYRFERVSRTEVKRVTLATMAEEILSATPNPQGEHINVDSCIKRRIAGGRGATFGTEATAVWFGGSTDHSLVRLSVLWSTHITPATGLLEDDHKTLTHNKDVLRAYFVIASTDFSDARRGVIEEEVVDHISEEEKPVIARRKHLVDWRNLSGVSGSTIDNILDRGKTVPVRHDIPRIESLIVDERQRTR